MKNTSDRKVDVWKWHDPTVLPEYAADLTFEVRMKRHVAARAHEG